MTRTETHRTSTRPTSTTGTCVLPPALAGLVRTAPVTPAHGWEPTTLHPGVARRTPALHGTVPLPGRDVVRPLAAPKHLGRRAATRARRETPVWAVAVVLAAAVTAAVGSLAGVLTQRPPAATAPDGTSVSAPATPVPTVPVDPARR